MYLIVKTNHVRTVGCHRWSLQWELWGLFALLTPVAALVLMVLKPAF